MNCSRPHSRIETFLWSKIQIKNFDVFDITNITAGVGRETFQKLYKKKCKREGFVELMPKSNITSYL
jgi:hypothetical protein